MAIINFIIAVFAIFTLPSTYRPSEKPWQRRLPEDIDWVGAIVLSAALGILLYVCATKTTSYRRLEDGVNIAFLVISIILLIAFPPWMKVQKRRGRPALIPNELWRKAAFTTIYSAVFFC